MAVPENLTQHKTWIGLAIQLAVNNVLSGQGGPFGAVIVKNGAVIANGVNIVTQNNDPTAHAEIVAIRKACERLGTFELKGCSIYASCEPCPMCLGAIYWSRLDVVYYAATHQDASASGFDDSFIYQEMAMPIASRNLKMVQIRHEEASRSFEAWQSQPNRIEY